MRAEAEINLAHLTANPYPGRGIVIGLNGTGEFVVQVYWVTGRSPNSRNRVFLKDGGRIYTAPADPSKVEDPSLIFYNAMNEADGVFVVSNGNQTDDVMRVASSHSLPNLDAVLRDRIYEPDAPNYTPRITAASNLALRDLITNEISVLRRLPTSDECERGYCSFEGLSPGFGYCVTTYSGDGNPLPAFRGDPYLLPLGRSMREVADAFWQTLNPEHRVSLAVKFIDTGTRASQTYIVNRYEQVSKP